MPGHITLQTAEELYVVMPGDKIPGPESKLPGRAGGEKLLHWTFGLDHRIKALPCHVFYAGQKPTGLRLEWDT